MEQTNLSRFTVSRRTNDLSDYVNEILNDRLKLCAAISLALDEGTGISDTPNLSYSSGQLLLALMLLKSI